MPEQQKNELLFVRVGYDSATRLHLVWGATPSGQARFISLTHSQALAMVAQVAKSLHRAGAVVEAPNV